MIDLKELEDLADRLVRELRTALDYDDVDAEVERALATAEEIQRSVSAAIRG